MKRTRCRYVIVLIARKPREIPYEVIRTIYCPSDDFIISQESAPAPAGIMVEFRIGATIPFVDNVKLKSSKSSPIVAYERNIARR
jgi:hypothetical protein